MNNRNAQVAQNHSQGSLNNSVAQINPAMLQAMVSDLIAQKYDEMSDASGPLGQSTNPDPVPCPDQLGYFRHFQYGGIYWTAATNAHEVHGDIYARWGALGWERTTSPLGYPLGDETGTPDGVGRYNHFQRGSIYWTPSTGAWEVLGAIRDKWASLGWERGPLGYPIAAEQHIAGSTNAYTAFQHGWIYWTPEDGAQEVHTDPALTPLPDQLGPFNSGDISFDTGVPVGGSAQVTLYKNGSYNFSGHFHDSGFPSYDVSFIAGIRSASGTLYTFANSGHMAGTDESGSRDHDWNVPGNNEAIAAGWADLARGANMNCRSGVNVDLGPLLDDLKQAITIIGQVITVVVAIVA